MNPCKDIVGGRQFEPLGLGWAVDHYDRKVQRAGGGELGVSTCSAGVFGDDEVDFVGLHQGFVGGFGKRAAIHNDLGLRQRKGRFGRVDKAQKVAVLRVWREVGQMHPPHGEHDIAGGTVKGRNGGGNVGDMGPVIAGLRGPWGTREGSERHVCSLGGGNGIMAHPGGEGVCGVDQMGDLVVAQESGEAIRPAKAADTLRQWLAHGAVDAAREADGALQAYLGHRAGEGRGLGRAAKDQEVGVHG